MSKNLKQVYTLYLYWAIDFVLLFLFKGSKGARVRREEELLLTERSLRTLQVSFLQSRAICDPGKTLISGTYMGLYWILCHLQISRLVFAHSQFLWKALLATRLKSKINFLKKVIVVKEMFEGNNFPFWKIYVRNIIPANYPAVDQVVDHVLKH